MSAEFILQPLSFPHLVRPPLRVERSNPPLLILFHGYGSNAEDLFDLAPHFPPELLIISAQAPIALQQGVYAWFPLDWSGGAPRSRPEDVEIARQHVRAIVGEVVAMYQGDPARVFLLGFSQGAILALSAALTAPNVAHGVIALSGRLPEEVRPLILPYAELPDLRIFMGHGTGDTVIPVAHARDARAHLDQQGIPLRYQEYTHGHGITGEEIRDIRRWFDERAIGGTEDLRDL
jgi:phospholipase/carboxylesterase